METVFAFQRSLREPVFSFLSNFWPLIATVLLIGAAWLFIEYTRSSAPTGFEIDASSDGGDGGDGGGD